MSGAKGFSLLEVVVALVIVGLGVATLLEIFSLGLRLGVRSTRQTVLVSHAQNLMGEVLIRRGTRSSDAEGVEDGVRWGVRWEPVERQIAVVDDDSWGLEEVTLEVSDSRGDRKVIKTLLLVRRKSDS